MNLFTSRVGVAPDVYDNTTDQLSSINPMFRVNRISPLAMQAITVFISTPAGPVRVDNVRVCDQLYDRVEDILRPLNVVVCHEMLDHTTREWVRGFTLYYNEKPLPKFDAMPLRLYNLGDNAVLSCSFDIMVGGSLNNICLPTYSHIRECEEQILNEMSMQSLPGFDFFRNQETISDYALKLVEDVSILGYQIVRAKSKVDYAVAALNYAKLRSTGPILRSDLVQDIMSCLEELFEFAMQSEPSTENFETYLQGARSLLDDYESFKKGPLVKRLYKLSMYCLANELFSGVGITMSKFQFSTLAQEAIKREYHMGPSFVHCLLDTMLFLCEQGVQCIKLGSIEPLVHGPKSYQQWFDKAMDLKIKSKCLSNPEPHGFTKFEFLKELSAAIEKGHAICKFAAQIGNNEKKLVRSILCDLQMIQSDCVTKGAAQKTRKAPFAILVYAGSSVGKSTFTDILFTYHAKVAKLPQGSEYRYAVNFADEFQSGFTTSQWCWLIDDIGFQDPRAAQGIDASLMNVIQANNNAPFITNQADLPDKGRIPMWCEQVIGTTNVKHLNANYYFTNPLAVQRRFPYVVELAVKQEFAKDGVMLDGQKVKQVGEQEYPDWWEITVQRVIPKLGCPIDAQRADYELELKTSSIAEFLIWYQKTWQAYDLQQKKVLNGNAQFDSITLCDCHHLPLRMCPSNASEMMQQALSFVERNQTGEDHVNCGCENGVYVRNGRAYPCNHESADEQPPRRVPGTLEEAADATLQMLHQEEALQYAWSQGWCAYFVALILQWSMYLFAEYAVFRTAVGWMYTFPVCRRLLWWGITSTVADSRVLHHIFGFMGARVQNRIGKANRLLALGAVLAAGVATYKLATWIFGRSRPEKIQAREKFSTQSGEGREPKPLEEKGENVWYKDNFVLTTFDISDASKSMCGKFPQVVEQITRQTVRLKCWLDSGKVQHQVMVCVKGQIYAANNHGIPVQSKTKCLLVQNESGDGINGNIELTITENQIVRFPDQDICFICLDNIPPRRGVMQYLQQNEIKGKFGGQLVTREIDGSVTTRALANAQWWSGYCTVYCQLMTYWKCNVTHPTVNGDCGSPLVLDTPLGPILAGLHALGNSGECAWGVYLTKSLVDAAMKKFRPQFMPSTPNMCVQSAARTLGPLHPKSVFRYISSGTCEVYGTFVGWRSSLKSRVRTSIIGDAVCERLGVEVQHGPPVMKGWLPWRIAATDMVNPTTSIPADKLEACVSAFKRDIDRLLPQSEIDLIHVLDMDTTINGAPGIKFVNKMPRDTSMGFPWKCSKKKHMIDAPSERHSDGMTFEPEVMDRVKECVSLYISGFRYMAIFTAHLKDEATKWKKILLGKTRVFTGAPADWSIVVRQYFLSCVRVIQRNKLIFEAGPGTNPQSTEWEMIGEYLTQHGANKMIAGDYASFDKSMPPSVILAAFDVLIHLCKKGGYTEDELKVCWGIAYDTAFPLVDFHGDLVQFYGSNPSGHPLTVIINGLANSLYMRYCYLELSPENECDTFKSNVSLITYGDDNAMGVSDNCPWFNHTAIQQCLAKVNITYTMADKEAESIPYISIDEVSFLKREWRMDEDVGHVLAPLEEASIHKMLTVQVASKSIAPEAQAIATIESALAEWFFYGKPTYEARLKDMLHIVEVCGLQQWIEPSTFVEWHVLKERFLQNSKDLA